MDNASDIALPEVAISAAHEKLTDLRARLLDLTLRNRFLNFTHRANAKAQLRLVDELPDQLFALLLENKNPFLLAPLPEPENEPKDERSTAFQEALATERTIDETYLTALDALGDDDPESAKTQQAERTLKDTVRSHLGMAAWTHGRDVAPAEWATRCGVSPHYDLPQAGDLEQAPKHQDTAMQTLLFADALERRGRGLIDEARRWREEKGVDALYLALGFLEWREAKASEKTLLAPLLLIPIKIERRQSPSGAKIFISLGDGGVKENEALRLKLAHDFGMALPRFHGEDAPDETPDNSASNTGDISPPPAATPEAYFNAVRDMAAARPEWRVRRYATFAPFTFANIAIYHDLAPENWAGKAALEHRALIAGLLGGRPLGDPSDFGGGDFREDRTADPAPLVLDADASQYAIVHAAVIEGQDLAVQGPPGTGKSQTIVNLIAAALNQGKRVLFVAEKAAALDVVAKRLADVGLGAFCMDLHGANARREEVLSALKARIDLAPPNSDQTRYAQALAEAKRLKTSLSEYAEAINRPYGALGLSVHDIIWKEQATRTVDLPTAIDDITLDDAAAITPYQADEVRSLLTRIADADQAFRDDHGAPEDHPWRPVGDAEIPQHQRQRLIQQIAAWRSMLEALGANDDAWRAQDIPPPETLIAQRVYAVAVAALPPPDAEIDAALFVALATPDARAELTGYIDAATARNAAFTVLAAAFEDAPKAKVQDGLDAFAAALHALAGDRPVSDLALIEQERLEQADHWDGHVTLARQFIQAVGVETPGGTATVGALNRSLAAATVLRAVPPAALPWRTLIAGNRDACATARMAKEGNAELTLARQRVRNLHGIDMTRMGDKAALTADENAIRAAGFMAGLFDGAFRSAKRRLRTAGFTQTDKPAMADALHTSGEYRQAEEAFTSSPTFAAALGLGFQGLETDFSGLEAAADFGDAVRAAFPGLDPETSHARRVLLNNEAHAFTELRDAAHSDGFETLTSAASTLHEEEPSTPLAGIAERYRRNIAHTGDFIARAQALGLRPTATPQMIEAAAQSQRDIAAAEATMAEGQAFGALSPDLPRLHATLAMAQKTAVALVDAPELAPAIFTAHYAAAYLLLQPIAATVTSAIEAEAAARRILDDAGYDANRLCKHLLEDNPPRLLANAAAAAEHSGEAGLDGWIAFRCHLKDAADFGLSDLLAAFLTAGRPLDQLIQGYDRTLYRSLVREALAATPALARHRGAKAADARARFQKIDREIQTRTAAVIAAALAVNKGPAGNSIGRVRDKTERALIEHYATQKRPRIPLRRLFAKAPQAIQALKPCLMLSPATVAEVLTPGAMAFDLLVIDEASQMRPEFAIGALARSGQAVIVGDEMQLPPTDFFNRSLDDGSDDSDDEDAQDKVRHESILALANAALKPERQLLWHYRSRHESLIAFSNQQFYDDKLVVFPASRTVGMGIEAGIGVSMQRVEGGRYISGRRINPDEADAIVMAAIERMKRQPNRSIGLVAMNMTQRELIQDRFNQLADGDPEVQSYLERWRAEGLDPFFIKNLETVQGDERDAILISTTYGPDQKTGVTMQRFGPLNGAHGHRRLNVLFTRARYETVLFTSMVASDIRVDAKSTAGLIAFRGFLEYAATGRLPPSASSSKEMESPFEEHVAKLLQQRGFEVEPQVGVAGYRIDLGVKHPSFPHGYIAGVECDGARYHSAASARDRDRLRQEALERLGWTILRVWSTDWFENPTGEVNRLIERLENAARLAAPVVDTPNAPAAPNAPDTQIAPDVSVEQGLL